MKFLNVSNFWNVVQGRPFIVQQPDGSQWQFLNVWEFLKYLRGRSFSVIPDDRPMPDLATLRSNVAANPDDVRTRIQFGALLATNGSLDEAYGEYLEAIVLLSNDQGADDGARRLANRAFARYMAAKILEQMGRDAEAREHWQGCADDLRMAVPHEKYLSENPHYIEAMAKLQ